MPNEEVGGAEVGIDFKVGGIGEMSSFSEKIGFAEKGIERAKEQAHELRTALVGVAGSLGVGFGVVELGKGFIDANRELEQMQKRLGSLVSSSYSVPGASPGENIARGFEVANDMLEKFQATALKTGLSRSILAEVASTMEPAFARAKKGTDELTESTIRLSELARTRGMDPREAAYEIEMATLGGRIGPMLRGLGVNRGAFEHETETQKLNTIEQLLSRNIGGADLGGGMGGAIGRIRAELDGIREVAGKPFFDAAARELDTMGRYLNAHQASIKGAASAISGEFVSGLHMAEGIAKLISRHMDAVKAGAIGIGEITATAFAVKEVSEIGGSIAKAFSGVAKMNSEGIGKNIGGSIGAAVQSAAIGYAIGTAIHSFLEHQKWDWYERLSDPGANRGISGKASEADAYEARAMKNVQDNIEARRFLESLGLGQKGHPQTWNELARTPQGWNAKRGEVPNAQNNFTGPITMTLQFDKDHDADEIGFSVSQVFAKLGQRPRQASGFANQGHQGT